MENNVPYLKVSGSFEEMGYVHGKYFANEIHSLFEDRINILVNSIKNIELAFLINICELLFKDIEKYDINLFKELNSIAEGAMINPWKLIVSGGYTDCIDIISNCSNNRFHECTIAINPNKGFILGTWDSHPSAMSSLIILERNPKKEPSTLALTTAGWPCQQGLNSHGVGFAVTNLTPSYAEPSGIIYIAFLSKIAKLRSTSEVSVMFKRTKFCSGHSYIVLDHKGEGKIFDTTASIGREYPVNQLATKANHYFPERNCIDDNSNYKYIIGSKLRRQELLELVKIVEAPSDFFNSLAKSKYVNRMDINKDVSTCAHFVISTNEMKIWYVKGFSEPNIKVQEKCLL